MAIVVGVGDTLLVRAEVHGRGGIIGDVCLIYDSDSEFDRFEFELDSPAVADFERGGVHHYLIARGPGRATLTVRTMGADPVELPFEVVHR